MNNSFKKNLIAASVGAALAAGSMAASANSLLFPFFSTASGAHSVLTLSNTDALFNSGTLPNFTTAAESLHYVYNYGTACVHYNTTGFMSVNDVMSHSIASTAAGGFGKVVGTDQSTPAYFPLANQTGFLVVSNLTSVSATALQGSMAIVDPATGMVVSYAGISNNLPTDAGNAADEGNFSGITDLNFALTTLPDAMVSTSWYGAVVGDMNTAITSNLNWTGAVRFSNGGLIWNNDEKPESGAMSKTIQCGGSVLTSELMNTAQAAAVGTNGGLVKATGTVITAALSTTDTIVDDATGVVMMKMQTVKAAVGAPFAGKQFLHRENVGY